MRPHRFVLLSFVLWASLAGGPPAAQGPSVVELLDRYASGKFEAVADELAGDVDLNELLKQLRRDGPNWIAAVAPPARARRELAAATFALEAARAGAWHEWKLVLKPPKMGEGLLAYQPPNILYWKAPPLPAARGDSAMTAGARLAVAALVAGAALRVQAQTVPASQPTQTFRTGTDMVIVDVSVRDGGRAVTGLRAEDFVVTDNGVRQRVESVEATAVPLDLTLVVDLSGNQKGSWAARVPISRTTSQIKEEVGRVAALLRPDDRVRLLAIDNHVRQVLPMQATEELGRAVPPACRHREDEGARHNQFGGRERGARDRGALGCAAAGRAHGNRPRQ